MHPEAREWADTRTWTADAIEQDAVAAAKTKSGLRVSVVIPARDESATIASIVRAVQTLTHGSHPIVDEIVVIDSDSTDATTAIARTAGATVVAAADTRPDLGSHSGKGEAIWKSLFVTSGDLLVFLDADVTTMTPAYVTRLIAPLVLDPNVALVKGFYDRDLTDASERQSGQGGRVTELLARPLIESWWPQLAGVAQPLAGEWAIRRSLIETLPIPSGYGVEFAVLIDTFQTMGLPAIAQVDLGSREHRHQDLLALSAMATEILSAAATRVPHGVAHVPSGIAHPVREEHGLTWTARPVNAVERPPVLSALAAPTAGSARRRSAQAQPRRHR